MFGSENITTKLRNTLNTLYINTNALKKYNNEDL